MKATHIPLLPPPPRSVRLDMTAAEASALLNIMKVDVSVPQVVERYNGTCVAATQLVMNRITTALSVIGVPPNASITVEDLT